MGGSRGRNFSFKRPVVVFVIVFLVIVLGVVAYQIRSARVALAPPVAANGPPTGDDGVGFDRTRLEYVLPCPSDYSAKATAYGQGLKLMGSEVTLEECRQLTNNANDDDRQDALSLAKLDGIESCIQYAGRFRFSCSNRPCWDCKKSMGQPSCETFGTPKYLMWTELTDYGPPEKYDCYLYAGIPVDGSVSLICDQGICAP